MRPSQVSPVARGPSSNRSLENASSGNGGVGNGNSGSGGSGDVPGGWFHGWSHDPRSWPSWLYAAAGAAIAAAWWNAVAEPKGRLDTTQAKVSVIIPVLNESKSISDTILSLQALEPPLWEIVIVDGGSQDNTVALAKKHGVKVVISGRGRPVQMNAGARASSGEVLCFLHADTQVPRDLVAVLRREFSDPKTVLTGFNTSIEYEDRRLNFMTAHNFIKTYYLPAIAMPLSFLSGLRIMFGDQVLSCRAADFFHAGGYKESLPIMEDASLCVSMHQAGPSPLTLAAAAASRDTLAESCSQPAVQAASPPDVRGMDVEEGCRSRADAAGSASAREAGVPLRRRGRVKMILDRHVVTSGRRLVAWGNLRATYIHCTFGLKWLLGASAPEMKQLYADLYTDRYR